jgi:NDP-hexose 4-ketoreductase
VGRVLLVGAGGFLGRHIDRALRTDPDHEVVAVSRRPPPDARQPWISADMADPAAAQATVAEVRPGVVINAAGAVDGNSDDLARPNEGLVAALLVAMAHASGARLVHIGSAAEYGPGMPGRAITESDPADPVSDYGRAKLRATTMVVAAAPDIQTVVLRVFNPIGAGAPPAGVVGAAVVAFRAAMAAGSSSAEFGPLGAYRDFVHVADVADAVLAAAVRPEATGIINVGSGSAVQVRDVVRELAEIAGFRGAITESPTGSSIRSRDVAWQQADIARAAAVLDWAPMRQRAEALREAWFGGPEVSTSDR